MDFSFGDGAIIAAFLSMPTATAQQLVVTNRGVVEIETSGTAGISLRIADDLANPIDDGAPRRMVPIGHLAGSNAPL